MADAIFGKIDPSGHLPVTWPSDAAAPGGDFNTGAPSPLGDQPKVFDQLPYTGSGQGSGYNPLYPFAYGLSYTTFNVTGLSATQSVSRAGTVTAAFTVSNTGSVAGTDVVPVYVHQPVSLVVVPAQRLVGFARVTLNPGQTKTVHVAFPGLGAGGHARRHQRCRPAAGGTRCLSGTDRYPGHPQRGLHHPQLTPRKGYSTETGHPGGSRPPLAGERAPAGVPFGMPAPPYGPVRTLARFSVLHRFH